MFYPTYSSCFIIDSKLVGFIMFYPFYLSCIHHRFPTSHIFRTHVTPWPLCWAWALASLISPVTPASALEIGPAAPASRGAWPAGQSSPCEVSLVQCPSSGAETTKKCGNWLKNVGKCVVEKKSCWDPKLVWLCGYNPSVVKPTMRGRLTWIHHPGEKKGGILPCGFPHVWWIYQRNGTWSTDKIENAACSKQNWMISLKNEESPRINEKNIVKHITISGKIV